MITNGRSFFRRILPRRKIQPIFSSEFSHVFPEDGFSQKIHFSSTPFIYFVVHMASPPHTAIVDRKDFHIERPSILNGRLIHTLIHYNTHRFKQLKEIDVLSRRAKDPSIISVFECSHANKNGCPCKFVLRDDQSGVIIGEHKQDAMHLNDVYSWRLFQAKLLILDDLINDPCIAPQRLIDKVSSSPDFIVDQFTPSKSALQSAIARLKAKVFGTIKVDIESLSDYFKGVRTLSNQVFTLHEETYTNEQQSTKRIIVLSSGFQLDIARRGPGMFMGDGTFDSVPSLFTQMYTIHALHGDSSFPIAFALMVEKTTNAYEILFGILKNNGVTINTFMSDFEKSSRNAVVNVYGDVRLKGCWFHYTQAIMRRVQKVGLQRVHDGVICEYNCEEAFCVAIHSTCRSPTSTRTDRTGNILLRG